MRRARPPCYYGEHAREAANRDHTMIQYYLFMGLLIFTLVLWGIIAFREDDLPEEQDASQPEDPDAN